MSARKHKLLGDLPVLCLGQRSLYRELNYAHSVSGDELPALLLLLPDASLEQLTTCLADQRYCLLPVLAFGAFQHPRIDYQAAALNDETLGQGLNRIAPIRRALEQMPAALNSNDVQLLAILGLAFSRARSIEAAWAPQHSSWIDYPLLLGIENRLALLDVLSEMGLLIRRPFDRLHQCLHCQSSRLNAREECPSCQSSFIEEVALIHHYGCGYLAPEQAYIKGRLLICPKCQKELRHYGVDYDKPGTQFLCSACANSSPDPDVGFVCIDCGRRSAGEAIATVDRYHYDLSGEGIKALQEGLLPSVSISSYVQNLHSYYSQREFVSLAAHQQKLALRYQRPLCACVVSMDNADELMLSIGKQTLAKSFVLLSEVIAQSLRETDLLTARDRQIYLVLPETPPEQMSILLQRLQERVAQALSIELKLSDEQFDLPGFDDFLSRFG